MSRFSRIATYQLDFFFRSEGYTEKRGKEQQKINTNMQRMSEKQTKQYKRRCMAMTKSFILQIEEYST